MKMIAVVVTAFAAGYSAHWLQLRAMSSDFRPGVDPPSSVEEHWKVVNAYRAKMNSPENEIEDEATGLYGHVVPFDQTPSLEALVAAGELRKFDLIFPRVPVSNKANRLFFRFVEEHQDDGIVEAVGNTDYGSFMPKGQQPMHLTIWCKESAVKVVEELIREMDALGNDHRN